MWINTNRFKRITFYLLICWSKLTQAEQIDLTIGMINAGGQAYFIELLEQALGAAGHTVSITTQGPFPQKRVMYLLENDKVSLMWLLRSPARDKRYTPVNVNLTNGLIGHRILLIPPDAQEAYRGIRNLDDFRKTEKVGVFGEHWYDTEIWRFNQLPFVISRGDWQRNVYRLIAAQNRGIDYFSRGFFEVMEESREHPYLHIEEHLVFIYERDFQLYLSKSFAQYKPLLENALKFARDSGLMAVLIHKHWADAFARLNLEQRTKIHLATPAHSRLP
ncbi:hypothetical protein OLMES_4137 [Oleiphilus messinensis]|uniref:Solute-binding protein family 3/N-terminal domain-containing protein n=1 Tax=Oleiphilus messinensis TaxID=141451 RepID=A0A1Y0IFK8_9GAMM|nr:hypothetical protein [Oleiphilus messinensis]ARU58154.1 hypothetical protein OLMES_4137 [Oleiphilus messinensis]